MLKMGLKVDTPHQQKLPFTHHRTLNLRAGSLRTKESILESLKRCIDDSGISRDDLSEEISRLVGEYVSVHTINNYLAEGKTNRRFPLEFALAVAMIVGSHDFISAALNSFMEIIGPDDVAAMKYGRMLLEDEERSKLKKELKSIALKNKMNS